MTKEKENGNGAKDKIIAKALKHLEISKIRPKNKDVIAAFIDQLAAEGLTKDRQAKYVYTTIKISERLNKDFSKVNKDDVIRVIGDINNSNYSEWTKRDYRILFKRLMKFVRESEGQEFPRKQYPPEVSWLDSTMKKSRKKLPKELLSIDDVKKLAEATFNLRDKAFIIFLYESGARIGEVLNIRLKDLEFDQYGAKVTLMGKTGARKIRVIASPPVISNWLKHHPLKSDKNAWLICGLNRSTRGNQGEYWYFNKLLRVAANRIGLKKPVNPHNFRHSRATELAKKLTEAQLCAYMGWEIGSREAATYVHLSGRDTDKAILALHGLAEPETEKDTFTPITCPRCGLKNEPGAKYCSGCSLGLDEKTILEFDTKKDLIGRNMDDMLDDPEILRTLIDRLSAQLEKKKVVKHHS